MFVFALSLQEMLHCRVYLAILKRIQIDLSGG